MDAYSDLKKSYFDGMKGEPIVFTKLTFTDYLLTVHNIKLPSWYDNYTDILLNEDKRQYVITARNSGKAWLDKMIDEYKKYRED